MIRRLLLLLGGSAAFCLLVGLPARHLGGGNSAVVIIATALALCLVPAIVILFWGERALLRAEPLLTFIRNIFVPVVAGLLVDHHFGWTPWGGVAGAALGLCVALVHLLNKKDSKDSYPSRQEFR